MSGESQMFLAKALYDNIAETPDELAFRRGDVLTVLEQDTGGLVGWWLCSLRGRQGIAPGNRLKILSGMEGAGKSGMSDHEIAKAEWRRSLEESPNKVVTPVRRGDIYLYNHPDRSIQDYDVPPSRYFPSSKESSPEPASELYDTPSNRPALPDNSLYDTPPSSKRASSERTPPGSHRGSVDSLSSASGGSHRLSGGQLYQIPPSSKRVSAESLSAIPPVPGGGHRLSGGERHYETPPGSKRASLERILSDDQPTYDTPSPSRSHQELCAEATYNTPSSRRQSRDSTGAGSRASILSTASSESCLSGSSSQLTANRHSTAASLPDSARSSLDASLHEPYDLPPRETRALKQLSMDSGLGLYDTPASGRPRANSPQPPHLVSSASHLSDLSRDQRPPVDIKRSRSLEHALDDIYDCPRNNAPKISLKSTVPAFGSTSAVNHDPSAVYDIPPQVTRDSIISARSDSSDESLRLSSCSVDSRSSGTDFVGVAEGEYEELLLDLDSALELLVKLQQDVTRAASRFMAFVSSTWRTKESLQTRVYDIKVACVELKKALVEFVEFAQGTLANSARLSDKKLISRLVRQVTPLQQQRKAISDALRSLEEKKWQVALLSEPLEAGGTDDLGTITNIAKDLGPDVKKLASLIQGNSTLLFKRSSDLASQSQAAADNSHVASKPPIGPKPEPAPKPNANAGTGAGGNARPRTLQQRPLPPPPGRPLPPTPLEVKMRAMELTGSLDNLADYMNVAGEVAGNKDDSDRDYSDLAQEYDYVQLETCDVAAQQQSKEKQKQQNKEERQQKQQQQQQSADSKDQQKEPPTDCKDQQKLQQQQKVPKQQPQTDSKPVPEKPETVCLEPEEKKDGPEVQKYLQKHTARMSADLGDKLLDVDMVPTKENSAADKSVGDSSSSDIPDRSLQNADSEAADDSDLKTPVNVNGFKIPNVNDRPLSTGLDLNGTTLDANDKQVLVYYSGQLETHSTLLTNAIDAFFTCIENNEPPKVFISNSKFVIITAHKLVYISDALHRSLMNCEVRNKVMHCANHVCECLKVSVQATKMAALQYPSVPAVQEMVDRVVDVSHAAHELKLVITQASKL